MKIIGELRLIPKGTEVWSIALQEMVTFKNDIVIKISNTTCTNDYVFAKIQTVLQAFFVGTYNKHNGDIGLNYSDTKPYQLPDSLFINPQIIKQ